MRQMYLVIILALWPPGADARPSDSCKNDNNMKSWQPKWSDESRDDLLCNYRDCPELGPGFKPEYQKPDKCCTCYSCTTWNGDEIDLSIEYVSVLGRSLVIPEQPPNSSEVYRVKNQDSNMTEIPSNICNWDNETNLAELYGYYFLNMSIVWNNLVEMDFTGNKIRRIPNINCLGRLDKLYLNQNNIESVSNSSFTNLTRLRIISLEDNKLKNLEPSILTSPNLNIFYAYLGQNELDKLDVSNMISIYPFCWIDYKNNSISELVNENDFRLDMDKSYGPGRLSFEGNAFVAMPNFKDLLHLDSWEQMGKLLNFGFQFSGVPIICDCNLQPVLSLAKGIIEVILQDSYDVICAGPEKHAGKSVIDIPNEEFICPIPQNKGCQSPQCTCVDKPHDDTLYIDCSNTKLDTMPHIPASNHSQFVSLNVSGNFIKEIANMSYLSKLISLDISSNQLEEISDEMAKQLENCTDIDISGNAKIQGLPKTFQYRNICNTFMRNVTIDCNCDSKWLETWVDSRKCETNHLFICDIPDVGLKQAEDFHKSDIDCFLNSIFYILGSSIAAAALALLTTSMSMYWFRYELLIIFLRLRHKKRNTVLPYKYDVFISFNENQEHVTKWVIKSLYPRLQESGYVIFLALKNLDYGAERNSGVIAAIQNSRNFLIVLSESYLEQADEGMRSWTENEWKYGWNNFRQDRGKNIVLVNYDHMVPSEVVHPVIRAYLRVGCTVDFENHDRNIMHDIETKLGKPIELNDIDTKVNNNMNKKLSPYNLFITSPHKDHESDLEFDLEEKMNNVDHSIENMHHTANFKFHHKPKTCKYRKCYACKQKELAKMER